MGKPVCCDRGKGDARHKQTSDSWAHIPEVHSRKTGAPKASPSPDAVGIIDGEREPLPE